MSSLVAIIFVQGRLYSIYQSESSMRTAQFVYELKRKAYNNGFHVTVEYISTDCLDYGRF